MKKKISRGAAEREHSGRAFLRRHIYTEIRKMKRNRAHEGWERDVPGRRWSIQGLCNQKILHFGSVPGIVLESLHNW